MTRILADLPDDDIRWMDRIAKEQGKSRAAILREAVVAFRADGPQDWIDRGFGAWKSRDDIGDSVEWQRRERASWTRPWDVDYEEVRAEFPDLFDEEDDREHELHLAWLAQNGMSQGDGYATPETLTERRAGEGSKPKSTKRAKA
ncbi:CopG family transcriptional regulator [Novosphingobium sp. Gsoil 351]|uniref:CopG family transcriptional regulator n=1 Tax=Novosphingobium sp. Gsoil 351 TaxID=2675225 RepID=UPI001E519E7F|nr:CopG family transcriptional regulator [Novosphingobium sp. Gsoil 351]